MTKRRGHLDQDRAIRNTAKALLLANLESMRGFFEVNANRERLTMRASEEARELAKDAGKAAKDNKGAIAFLAAAIFLWFGRDEIISLLSRSTNPGDDGVGSDDQVEDAEAEANASEIEEAI